MLTAFEFDVERSQIGVRVNLIGRKLSYRRMPTEKEFDDCYTALVKAAEELKELRSKERSMI